ncbi:flagellar motor switch protein FliN [Neorhizobium galegae]|uniref:flagellar motor switch protein FliN n=1 Tax=Neorhizobium galegae TaxID=399 RepID=UPI000620ECCC|nr:flagellar motor switch protein FliN [Neorhizobium galegae]CDZ30104.1 Flagellar motor switch protein FliN [Neorhizobium galegae bv. officinalis]KAA9385897.1 flagellar motor switch protein FliN [Neorhizobium galegae]KAB1113675.1 flagellar motor switch protein FliN [Neorhizobium galegae]MCM2496634.1 flagellar motor switch protein FliN [Neorhizobium galegae]MCQ1764078.1 flagellar motor switch protein FliN [Neorhizobium galegae]
MATKKTPLTDDDSLMPLGNDADLDQAIDDLRGVLKTDADGGAPDFDADFGSSATSDFSADAPSFGGGFEAQADTFGSSFGGGASGLGGAKSFGGNDFGSSTSSSAAYQEPGSALNANLDLIMDIPIDVEIVLGTSRMQVSGLMTLEEGATIALDKKIGEPVEIVVNGRRIGKGEITVLENDDTRFGVRLTEVLSTRRT